jgi:beta-galactosidase
MTGLRNPSMKSFGRLLNKDIESLADIEMQEQFALIKQENTKITYPLNSTKQEYTGSLWYDDFKPLATEVLATYDSRFLKGKPAVVKNRVGKGVVFYVGTVPSDEMINQLVGDFVSNAHIVPLAKCGNKLVDITELKGVKKYVYAINFSQEDQKIALASLMKDVLTDKTETSSVIKAMDYKVFEVE